MSEPHPTVLKFLTARLVEQAGPTDVVVVNEKSVASFLPDLLSKISAEGDREVILEVYDANWQKTDSRQKIKALRISKGPFSEMTCAVEYHRAREAPGEGPLPLTTAVKVV